MSFFMEKGWTVDETMECPLYTAYLLMGGISRDKLGLKLSARDAAIYQAALAQKRRGL